MALSWSGRRQILYYGVAFVILAVLATTAYQVFFTAPAMCNDGAKNGFERGVDCGGVCSLVCAADAKAPVVLWARAFKGAGTLYTAAAYLENRNAGAGAKSVRYSFQLFDDKNLLIVERSGTTDIPPIVTVPIVEPNINVGQRTVARTLFAFEEVPVWSKPPPLPVLAVHEQRLAEDGSRLSATVTNDTLKTVRATIAAVLFDSSGTARAASRSTLELPKSSSKPVVFTWPQPILDIVRAEMTVLPAF